RELGKNEVMDIFLGRKLRFPDGTLAMPIDQKTGSPARDEFYTNVAGMSAVQLKAHWSKAIFTGRGKPPRAASNGVEARSLIAADPEASGYIERDLVDETVKVLTPR